MLFLTWLPTLALVLCLMVLLSDPRLLLTISWSVLRGVPASITEGIRGWVLQWSQSPSQLHFQQSAHIGHTLFQETIPAQGPPMCPPCPSMPASAETSTNLYALLFAGEGGAVIALFTAAKAGMLRLGAGGGPP